MTTRRVPFLIAAFVSLLPAAAPAQPGTWVLPSSVLRPGLNQAEFRTDVRVLNLGLQAVSVTATFYDQASGATIPAAPFTIAGRSQRAYDNVLASLFGRTLENGSFGPIRFDASGPIVVSASVNNVNACLTGATSGQWLPGISAAQALTAGAIAQLAVSASGAAGYRSNLVVMNPGSAPATVTIRVQDGQGERLSTGTVGPLGPGGFAQVPLDSGGTFPGVAGRTDTNLWVGFSSTQPVLAFASVINNASGDPFAVVATPDPAGEPSIPPTAFDGTWRGASSENRVVSFDVVGGRMVKLIYGGFAAGSAACPFDTFFTFEPGSPLDANGTFSFSVPSSPGSYGVTGTGTVNTSTGRATGLVSYTVTTGSLPARATCAGTGSASFSTNRTAPPPASQSWDGTWRGASSQNRVVEIDVLGNRIVKVIYGGFAEGSAACPFDTFVLPQPGYPIGPNGSFTFEVPSSPGSLGVTATGNLVVTGTATGLYEYTVTASSIPARPTCSGTGYAAFSLNRVGGAPPAAIESGEPGE